MAHAAELYALQEIDLAIDAAVLRLSEVEALLGETEELRNARQQAEEARDGVHAQRERQKSLEWDADEVRSKSKEIEGKLYGGTVRNPKELEDLQADLVSVRGQLGKRDDALLEAMVEMEDAESQLRRAEEELAQVEASWRAEQGSLGAEQAQLNGEIVALEAGRTAQVDGVDARGLSLYEALRKRRGGSAVAMVERGLCHGCRIALPMSVVQKARSGLGLVQCVSCERILLVS